MVLAGLLFFLSSCRTIQLPRIPYPDDRNDRNERREDKEVNEEGRGLPFASLGIPKGHLPPPGSCKIWYPGRPPGQQPPPQSCANALRNAPLGAWVITHEGNRYKVNIFNRNRKGIIDEIKYYLDSE